MLSASIQPFMSIRGTINVSTYEHVCGLHHKLQSSDLSVRTGRVSPTVSRQLERKCYQLQCSHL
eukprot:881445-Karenia_brevis.AAC.1